MINLRRMRWAREKRRAYRYWREAREKEVTKKTKMSVGRYF
jgi:hypothetical protein